MWQIAGGILIAAAVLGSLKLAVWAIGAAWNAWIGAEQPDDER